MEINKSKLPKWVQAQMPEVTERGRGYYFDKYDGNIQGYIKALPGDENQDPVFFNADNMKELFHEFKIYRTRYSRFGINY